MINTKVCTTALATLIAFSSFAESNENLLHCSPNSGSLESAVTYIDSYHSHLRTGLNRKQLSGYWSDELVKQMDNAVYDLATELRNNVAEEAQRYIDTLMNEARCENYKLLSDKGFRDGSSFASLKYKVTPTCTDWRNLTNRSLELSFSETKCAWMITDIHDEVKYK